MAQTISITVQDDTKVTRFRTALGFNLNTDHSLATVTQAQDWFRSKMKEYTIDFETTNDAVTNRNNKSAESWA